MLILHAQTPITSFTTTTFSGTTSTDVVVAPNDTGNGLADDAGETFTINYATGNDIRITSYTVSGTVFDRFILPDTLVLNRRVPNDRLVNIWYESASIVDNTPPTNDIINMVPAAASDADAIYQTLAVNAGYDNILVNVDDLASGSIQVETERVDVIWFQGIQTSTPANAVFPVLERAGNDNVAVAAITSLNNDGTPASYGTIIGVGENFWTGGTAYTVPDFVVLRRETAGTDPIPLLDLGSQNVEGMSFTFTELGISANQTVYGYSIFAADVVSGYSQGTTLTSGPGTVAVGVDLTDISTFPNSTLSSDSGMDLIAGVSTAVSSDDNLIETKGPGGFKSPLATWLKANDGAFVSNGGAASSDGGIVGFWEDQSIGNHDFSTSGTAPTFRNNSTNNINFNPTVDFLENLERGLTTPINESYNVKSVNDGYQRKSLNITFRTNGNDISTKQQLFEEGGGTNGLGVYIRGGNIYASAWNRGNTVAPTAPWNSGTPTSFISTSLELDTEYILTFEMDGDNTGTNGTLTAYLNGQSFGSLPNVGLLFNHGGDIELGDSGGSRYDDNTTTASSFEGEISEFIYCNEPGSFPIQQRNRIESYLAIKYGITLDQSTPINYFNADGDIIFDATNNASLGGFLEYNNDIAGIGRDDASELDQPASRSENTGSVVTIDRGSTISTDDTWLIWGNDGGLLSETSLLSAPSNIETRLTRVWRASETNEVLTTSVSFDLTGLGLSTTASDFNLLIAGNNTNADFSNAQVISGGVYDAPTNTITFSGVDIDDGQYFTLGTSNFFCTPGNYSDGVVMWLRADQGVTTATEGQTVTDWQDQTEGDNDGTNLIAPIYRATSALINDNPTVDFTTGSTGIVIANSLPTNEDQSLSKKFSIVFRTDDDIATRQVIYEQGGGTRGLNLYIESGVLHLSAWNLANDGTGAPWNTGTFATVNTSAIVNYTTYLVTFDYDGNDAITGSVTGYLNGEIFGTPLTNIGRLYPHVNDIGLGNQNSDSRYADGSTSGASSFDGFIPEIVYYNAPSSYLSTDRNRVESNLAIKYGVTLDQNSPTNYTRSDAQVIWNATDNATYNNDIAGIGRDDNACLNQKQSKSENSGSIVKMGLATISATNSANPNTFDNDGEFLVWGSDGDLADQANANTNDVPGIVTERMERIWKVDESGTVGNTAIQFDLTGLGYSTNVSDFNLIISNSSTMASGTVTPAASLVNNILTFNNIDLTDGQFFTIGTARTSCGPGGITTGLTLWLKADQGTKLSNNSVTSGDIDEWENATVNASFSNVTTGNTNPNKVEAGVNFNPYVEFNGINEDLILDNVNADALFSNQNNTIFYSFNYLTSAGVVMAGWESDGTAERLAYYEKNGNSLRNNMIGGTNLLGTEDITNRFVISTTLSNATNRTLFINGNQDDQEAAASFTAAGNQGDFAIGSQPGGANYGANQAAEMIVFNDDLTAVDINKVESYLAIKYGITLNNSGGGTDGDYTRADGTNIWDADFNDGINGAGTYHNDVAGIGRDDDGCFSQKQSSSINSDDILSVGLGSIASSNANNTNSFDDSGDYFVWGNDNGSTSSGSAETGDVPATISERMTRIWRAEDSGNVGATELQFDLNSTGFQTVDASAYSLLVSDSEDMASATIFTGGTINSGVLSFSGIDIADGQYFTIGTQFTTCGPGGVNTNISVWFRADEEAYSDLGTTLATDGQDILQWGDQSSPIIDALEVDLGGGASAIEPTFETNEFNFNPVARFTDPNSNNSSYFQTPSTAVTGDFTLISIFKTGQAQGTDEDVLNSPTLISARNAGTADYSMGIQGGTIWLDADSDNGFEVQTTGTYNNNQVHIATSVKSGTALNLFVDSENVGSGTGSATLGSATGYGIGNHFNSDLQAQFAGDIAETIVFSSALSSEDRNKVESYLALKYGITRDGSDDGATGGVDERDYRAGDGGVIWDFDGQNPTYYNDIFGIGRDDLSCFEQTQSKSENSDALVTFSQSGSFANDDSFLISGNDNTAVEQEGNSERPPGINSRLNREWRVQETGTVESIEVTYDMSTITGPLGVGTNNLGQLRLMVDDDGDFTSGVTLLSPTSFNGSENTVTFTVNFTNGQYYTLGSEEKAALPVELLSFEANAENERVDLNWSTVSEINNAFFTIERSANGMDFESIINIDGAGTSQGVIHYHYADRNPLAGFSFYRLRQTDFSGEFDYSEVQSVYVERSKEIKISLFPNPIRIGETLKMSHNLLEPQKAIIQIFDLNGRISLKQEIQLEPIKALVEIETKTMTRGINVIKLILQGGESFTFRVLVK